MRGVVDDSGRAILPIEILCPKYPTGVRVDAWIDTGFTGDLVLPQSLIDDLQLEITGSIDGVLADGSAIEHQPTTVSSIGSVNEGHWR